LSAVAGSHAAVVLDIPEVEVEGLVLRPWHLDDAPQLVAGWLDPEVARTTGVPSRPDLATARHWIAGADDRRRDGRALDLVIADGATGAFCGEVGLAPVEAERRRANVGYWVARHRRGSGVATRAVVALADWSLVATGLTLLVAATRTDNPASRRVLERAGFSVVRRVGDHEVFSRSR
jgi:RimJ/RimL family protein N-acetyltransferase